MLKIKQPGDQARQGGGATGVGRKQAVPFPLEDLPVNQGSRLHRFVAHVDHLDQPCAQKIVLFYRCFFGFISWLEFARFLPQ